MAYAFPTTLSGTMRGIDLGDRPATLRRAFEAWAERRRTRAALHRLGPRLMRDAGLDDAAIETIAGAAWEREGIPGFLILAPRRR